MLNLGAGEHSQISRLVRAAVLHRFLTRYSTKPGGSSSTTRRRISARLPISPIHICSTGSRQKLLPTGLPSSPRQGSSVSGTQSLLCRHTYHHVSSEQVLHSFYIIGVNREIYIRDHPAKSCWGLCCCVEWLKV